MITYLLTVVTIACISQTHDWATNISALPGNIIVVDVLSLDYHANCKDGRDEVAVDVHFDCGMKSVWVVGRK